MASTFVPTWLKELVGTGRRGRTWNSHPRRRVSVLPRLEVLEDRTQPSVVTVKNANDSGKGSLRDAIAGCQGRLRSFIFCSYY